MTNNDNTSEQRVFFDYNWGNTPMPRPTNSIASVSQVIRAMNDLIQGHRDPNEWTDNPDSDTRAGIRHIFEACAAQLDIAHTALDAQNQPVIQQDDTYPRLDAIKAEHSEPLSFDDWQTAAQWSEHKLDGIPHTFIGMMDTIERDGWRDLGSDKARQSNGTDGVWEYHVSALPKTAQMAFETRKAFFSTAYNHKATG